MLSTDSKTHILQGNIVCRPRQSFARVALEALIAALSAFSPQASEDLRERPRIAPSPHFLRAECTPSPAFSLSSTFTLLDRALLFKRMVASHPRMKDPMYHGAYQR